MEPAISIQGVSKKYSIGQAKSGSLRETLASKFKKKDVASEFWALDDVSFDVMPGDVLGIIGKNGAGKSTLLKILSRITYPTKGRIAINGRVASLLEVGTGFHPELTGRENIYLNGTILGMNRAEVKSKFDEIVEFSGVSKFIDNPVKHYSSGMYVRLAFAVAAHLEPEILIVDEVLAVGDAEFQKKCIGKMQDVSKNSGRTVLFVSHNLLAVKELCNRGVVIEKGRVIFDGSTRDAVNVYQNNHVSQSFEEDWEEGQEPGNEEIKIKKVKIVGGNEGQISIADIFEVSITFEVLKEKKNVGMSVFVVNEDQILMFEAFANVSELDLVKGIYTISYHFPNFMMNAGQYSFKFLFAENQQYILYNSDFLLHFDMQNVAYNTGSFLGVTPGVIKPKFTVTKTHHGLTE